MQNPIQKSRQSSIVFEKPGILPGNLRSFTSSSYPTIQYFLLKLSTLYYLPMSIKGCVGFFLFCLDLELFTKIKKYLVIVLTMRNILEITMFDWISLHLPVILQR